MIRTDVRELMGPELAAALDRKGYDALTPVQEAVLDPAIDGRDLRISSQTGSGKTLAIGLILREAAALEATAEGGIGKPNALVIVPTRELAKQVEEELRWFYAPLGARVVSVTGGAGYRDERRALAQGPSVVVGTPGRLLDHLERGAIDPSSVRSVVLDEADRMLDLGFREALESILGHAPPGHRTHLVSATFPNDVRALADHVQEDPVHVQGTPLGSANADIDHVVHLVAETERVDAMINLLLAGPDGQTLIFARTRADVAEITAQLGRAGFRVAPLSGEMEQRERTRALSAFRRGDLHALVATDVAARGIDVQDIARVVHAEPPSDADTYTHRSGRTGRAGRKGTSSILVMPSQLSWTKQLLKRARVTLRFEPIPTAEAIRVASDERTARLLQGDDAEPDPKSLALAERLLAETEATNLVAKLLARFRSTGPTEPREVQLLVPPERPSRARDDRRDRGGRVARGERTERTGAPRSDYDRPREDRAKPERSAPRRATGGADGWVPFRVTWGGLHGADPRRLLAIVCRRGGIRGSDVGAIDVQRSFSVVHVAREVAASFAEEAKRPDPRDPRVRIAPFDEARSARPSPHPRDEGEPWSEARPKRPAHRAESEPRAEHESEARPKRPAHRADDERSARDSDARPKKPAYRAGTERGAEPRHDARPKKPAYRADGERPVPAKGPTKPAKKPTRPPYPKARKVPRAPR